MVGVYVGNSIYSLPQDEVRAKLYVGNSNTPVQSGLPMLASQRVSPPTLDQKFCAIEKKRINGGAKTRA